MERFNTYRNVEVQGALGKIVFRSMPMSMEEARFFWGQGISVPLDLLPAEHWSMADPDGNRPPDETVMPGSEEALGDRF